MLKKRPTWNQIWMLLATSVADRSYDEKTKVGSVVVTEDNTSVLAIGYNGDEKGGENKRDSNVRGESGFIHAEANALLKLNFIDPRNKKMYITSSPCIVCARMIINADIKEVIYLEEFRETKGIELLEARGVKVQEAFGYEINKRR